MDPNRHANPRDFDPARYSDDFQTAAEAAANPNPSKRDQFVFGAGRRICQGIHIAERSLFLGIARLLWAFNFDYAIDDTGQKIVPDIDDLTEGLFALPKPFRVCITPRSERRAEIIRSEWARCQPLLDGNMQWKEIPEGMLFSTYVPEK